MNRTAHKAPAPVTRTERVLVLGGLALALAATPMLLLLSAPTSVTGAVWMLAILWTVAASLGHALWLGAVHGDWSRFGTSCAAQARARRETLSWTTRTGRYAYRGISERNEALARDNPPFADGSGHVVSL